ncbi:ABC transporter ATP-binding protein [Rothia nasimurium]|uniref:ABC transporter ATP-binding protein n=1 Tax=Rothia nasimurium TaxID=85336 RepID=UPI003618CE8C
MTTAIEIISVNKTFRTRTATVEAVKDVSFSVQTGEIVALLGENGAGKSTLIDMLLGLTEPTSGTVKLWGSSPSQAVAEGRVSAVLQTGGLLTDLSVHDQVAMLAATYPGRPDVDAALEAAGISHIARRKISKCSGGQQQKVKFAIALLGDPDLLFLDEPTAGMDVNAREQFWESMRAQAAAGKTILFATHYLEEAQEFAQRIVVLAGGQLIMDGTQRTIRNHADTRAISFTLDAPALHLTQEQTHDWGVSNYTVNQTTHSLHCHKAEAFALHLLQNHRITDLEIVTPSLAEAFTQLTTRTTGEKI